jgi:hypothetical protein
MTKPKNGFHVAMQYKNQHADLYSVQWIKNGDAIAGIDFVDHKIDRIYALERLPKTFINRLKTIAIAKRNAQ